MSHRTLKIGGKSNFLLIFIIPGAEFGLEFQSMGCLKSNSKVRFYSVLAEMSVENLKICTEVESNSDSRGNKQNCLSSVRKSNENVVRLRLEVCIECRSQMLAEIETNTKTGWEL